jgi:putative tricarboxylic transport membrane protein
MTTTRSEPTQPTGPTGPTEHRVDSAQYVLAAVLALVGVYTLYDATTLNVGFGDPVGPRVFPYVIGSVMIALAILLAIATARGDLPAAEEGEDVDLTTKPDWVTVAKLLGFFAFNIATVNLLGWAITGAILFAGCAWSLGSRTVLRDVIIGAVLSVSSWYFFYSGLGIALTPGILDGIL